MTDVRSAALGRAFSATATQWLIHIVPAGSTTLLKSVYFSNDDAASQRCIAWVKIGADAWVVRLFSADVVAGGEANWQGWMALSPGDEIHVYMGANASAWVSGTVLNGVVSPTPPDPVPTVVQTLPADPIGSFSAGVALDRARQRRRSRP